VEIESVNRTQGVQVFKKADGLEKIEHTTNSEKKRVVELSNPRHQGETNGGTQERDGDQKGDKNGAETGSAIKEVG